MTAASLPETEGRADVGVAVQRAIRILLAYQDDAGWWPDRAVAGVSLAAEALLARWFLRGGEARGPDVAAGLIRSSQRADGSWAGAEPGATADLSASVLSYLALALAGDSPDAYHMATAAGWIRDAGGIDAVGVTARAWLALFGVTAWTDVPVPSPEDLWLPARGAQTCSPVVAVTLAILGAVRPVRARGIGLAELRASRAMPEAGNRHRPVGVRGAARSVARPAALRRCGGWLARWQEHSPNPGGLRPGWPLSLVALHAVGCRADNPPAEDGLPPLAHTALTVDALRAAGLPADHPSIAAAARWLLRCRIEAPALGGGAGVDAVPAAGRSALTAIRGQPTPRSSLARWAGSSRPARRSSPPRLGGWLERRTGTVAGTAPPSSPDTACARSPRAVLTIRPRNRPSAAGSSGCCVRSGPGARGQVAGAAATCSPPASCLRRCCRPGCGPESRASPAAPAGCSLSRMLMAAGTSAG